MLSSALCWLTLQMGCRFLWLWGLERPHLPTDFQFGGIQEHTQITGLFILLQLFVVHHVTKHSTASMKYLQACQSTLLWWGLHNIKHWWWNDGNRPPQKGDAYIGNIYCRRHHVDKYNMEHTYIYIYMVMYSPCLGFSNLLNSQKTVTPSFEVLHRRLGEAKDDSDPEGPNVLNQPVFFRLKNHYSDHYSDHLVVGLELFFP